MKKITVKLGATEANFFKRGHQVAAAADKGERLPKERILSFEDPEDFARLVKGTQMALFKAIKESPGSITDIAKRLNRDRGAVKRDIDAMLRVGLVTITEKPFPGHGRMKEVRTTANSFRLVTVIA